MWTKRNDHAPKNECALFITAQKGVFERKKTSSLTILLFSSSLPHKENLKNNNYNNISLPWALAFSTKAPLIASPIAKSIGLC